MTELDLRLLHAMYGGADGPWGGPMLFLTALGEGWTALLLLPLLWSARTRAVATALALAVLTQGILVWALKVAFGRVRPWIAFGWPAPFRAPHDPSLPSGHAAGSFCVAVFVAVLLPALWRGRRAARRLFAAAALGLAGLIAASRVYLGCHFPSDVVAGAALGSAVGALAAIGHLRRRAQASPPRLERSAKRG